MAPKINEAGAASFYGNEGHVTNAVGAVSELDPSRNADGSVVDGYESDEREIEEREPGQHADEPTTLAPADEPEGADTEEDDAPAEAEDEKASAPVKRAPAKRAARGK